MLSSQKALLDAATKRANKLRAKGNAGLQGTAANGTGLWRDKYPQHALETLRRWLDVENCCVVPFTSFSEFNKTEGGDIWFALDKVGP